MKRSTYQFTNCWIAILISIPVFSSIGQVKIDNAQQSIALPACTYATIDVSGTTTTNSVTMMALGDNNQVAFAFMTAPNTITSIVWANGVTQTPNVVALSGTSVTVADPYEDPSNPDNIVINSGYGPNGAKIRRF